MRYATLRHIDADAADGTAPRYYVDIYRVVDA